LAWRIESDADAFEELQRFERQAQLRILRFLRETVAAGDDPYRLGKPLRGKRKELWRYRVGGFRIVCLIEHEICRVLVARVARRGDAYR